jgi:hypothetical protein
MEMKQEQKAGTIYLVLGARVSEQYFWRHALGPLVVEGNRSIGHVS